MAFSLLIAETPNAGKWGYRFLVSDGATIGDATVSAFVSKGRGESQAVGGNYIAVRHKVAQRTTGRPDAGETLVLVGVDTGRLSDKEQAQVIATLRSLLPEIDPAVQEIDWSTEKRLVVPHKTLAEWVSENIRTLPVVDYARGPQERGRTLRSVETEFPRNRPWKHAAIWFFVSVLILLAVTAVGLFTRRLPFHFGYPFVDTTKSGGSQSENGKNPQDDGANGSAANPSSGDVFAAKLDEIRGEARGTNDPARLNALKARLYELEGGQALTKREQRDVDDLRQELTTKQQTIKEEQARIRQENSRFYLEIENSLREAKDLGTLDSLLARLDQVPHPDKVTEDDHRLQNRLRDRIRSEQTELRWKDFVKEFRQLVSSGDFKQAAIHLQEWTGGKERELGVMQDEYKASLKDTVNKALDRGIKSATFRATRQMVRELFSSPAIDEVVGKSFLQPAWDRLDAAEDKYLYERIAASPSVAEEEDRVGAYLNSQVEKKRMRKAVEGLKQYFDTANDETTLTVTVTSIYWVNRSNWVNLWPGKHTVKLAITPEITPEGKEPIRTDPVQVTAETEKELRLNKTPVEISFKAKPSDRISLELRVYESENRNGTFSHNGTMAGLQRLSGEWVKLNVVPSRTADGNKIKFEVRGIPAKPTLPPWSGD